MLVQTILLKLISLVFCLHQFQITFIWYNVQNTGVKKLISMSDPQYTHTTIGQQNHYGQWLLFKIIKHIHSFLMLFLEIINSGLPAATYVVVSGSSLILWMAFTPPMGCYLV